MIAIDGAMSTHAGSGVDGVADTYTARADQLMLVDTDLTAEEVADRIINALDEAGVDAAEVGPSTFFVDSPGVRLETEDIGVVGHPRYEIEGADDWAASLTWGRTYEPVRVLWEGGPVPPDEIA